MRPKITEFKVCILVSLSIFLFQSCKKEVFVEPKSDETTTYTKIFINSQPGGSIIYVNGKTTGRVTPDTIKWLTEGTYQIKLKKKYFWDTVFTIATSQTQVANAYIDYFQSERMLGQIDCSSNPSGAKIYLDNTNTGQVTPAILTRIMPSLHKITFEYPEFRKDSVLIEVESSKKSFCGVSLEDTLDVITYTKKNSGLSNDHLKCFSEDKDGNMWFGSMGNGLYKFDGKLFKEYNQENSPYLPSNYIIYLKQDRNGELLAAFSNGLGIFDGYNWKFSMPTNFINSLNVSSKNVVLAATDRGGGVVRYSGSRFELLTQENGNIPNNFVTAACYDNADNMWVGRQNGGLDLFSGGKWTYLDSTHNGLPNTFVDILDVLKDGTVWGLFYYIYYPKTPIMFCSFAKYKGGVWETYYTTFDNVDLMNYFVDNKGRLWIGGTGSFKRLSDPYGVETLQSVIKRNEIRKYRTNSVLFQNECSKANNAYVDSKGNLWLITQNFGITKIKKGKWVD